MDIWSKLDQTEVATTSALIPVGEYTAIISDISIKEGSFPDEDTTEISVEYSLTTEGLENRKAWFNTKLGPKSSEKQLSFVKGQICKMAGVETTAGDPLGVLQHCKGNSVGITIKHEPGFKDNTKTYSKVFCNEKLA